MISSCSEEKYMENLLYVDLYERANESDEYYSDSKKFVDLEESVKDENEEQKYEILI